MRVNPQAVWPQQTWAVGGCAPFGGGRLSPHLTQCGQGRGLPPYQVASWSIQPFGHNTPTLQTGQWSCSIGRTVTCNSRPKKCLKRLKWIILQTSDSRHEECRIPDVRSHSMDQESSVSDFASSVSVLGVPFSALKLLLGQQEGNLACKNHSGRFSLVGPGSTWSSSWREGQLNKNQKVAVAELNYNVTDWPDTLRWIPSFTWKFTTLWIVNRRMKNGYTHLTILTHNNHQRSESWSHHSAVQHVWWPRLALLWPPYGIGQAIIFLPWDFFLLSFFLSFFLA